MPIDAVPVSILRHDKDTREDIGDTARDLHAGIGDGARMASRNATASATRLRTRQARRRRASSGVSRVNEMTGSWADIVILRA
jgi:hypothetical protein